MRNQWVIRPGSWIGILGGGQLGKMSAMAAARLGYKTIVWTPPGDVPATSIATKSILRPYDSQQGFDEFVARADVVTLEFENVPVELLDSLANHRGKNLVVRPSGRVLEVTQDRWLEKTFFERSGIKTAWTVHLDEFTADFDNLLRRTVFPAILKTRRLGYDGRGQIEVDSILELRAAFDKLGRVPCVLENKVDFICEGSVLIARNPNGETAVSPVFQNHHEGGILRTTEYPCTEVHPLQQAEAQDAAIKIAESLDLEGLLAGEFFFGKDGKVYANELAPRPHNSGHGTIEANSMSQFEAHIRAVCNLPLGDFMPNTPFRMQNLIGADVDTWEQFLSRPLTTLHLYGKDEAKPGRKMGHVTELLRR